MKRDYHTMTTTDALNEHPEAVRAVMEADGWEPCIGVPEWRKVIEANPNGNLPPYARQEFWVTPNDMIAACVRWLINHPRGNEEMSHWLSNGMEFWYEFKHYRAKDMNPLSRLLWAVQECMEGGE